MITSFSGLMVGIRGVCVKQKLMMVYGGKIL